MIRGNLNLSSDLRRLGFIKVILFLTHPSSFMYTDQLVSRYKRTVMKFREKEGWNVDLNSGVKVAGKGIGAETKSASEDIIALNHVLLAQKLGFLRKDVNNWSTHGRHLSSQYTESEGLPLSLNPQTREKLLKTKGLVANLSRSEQLIFCDALLTFDVDGTVPLIECMDTNTKPKSELIEEYFGKVASWYERKARIEVRAQVRSFYLREKASFAKKESKGGYSRVHREMQVEPRLHFLKDLGLINKSRSGYSLSNTGKRLRDSFSTLDDTQIKSLLDEKEKRLTILLSDLYGKGLPELPVADFDKTFVRMMNFYRSIGLILIPYESLYISIAASALNLSQTLPFSTYEKQLRRLAKLRGIGYSTTVPGRRYVKA